MRNERNLPVHELIGLEVKVSRSVCSEYIGIYGTVIDETKNTFIIKTSEGERIIPKKGTTFIFMINVKQVSKKVSIVGDDIMYRPEDRTKKLRLKI